MTDLDTTVTVIDAAARAHVPVLLWSDPGTGVGWWCLMRCNEAGFAGGRGLVGGQR